MSTITISTLPLTSTLTDATNFPVEISGVTKHVTAATIKSYAISDLSANLTSTNTALLTANTAMKSYVDAQTSAVTVAWAANAVVQQGLITTLQSQVYANSNVAAYLPTYTGNFSSANLTVSGVVTGNATTFTGSITGNLLTVTGATAGLISWGQYVQGSGVADDTFITYQNTGTSGGNGTYYVSVSQSVSARPMYVHGLYVDSDIKLTEGHGIYSQDEHDPGLYNLLIGIKAEEATVHVGDINTNGMSLTNNQEYKIDSALNVGTYMAVAKVDTTDNVILGSGNGNTTQIRVGGDTAIGGYGMKFKNGGQALIPVGLRIGDNINASIFNAPLEVGSLLAGAANNQSNPGGIALPTYRGTGNIIANDEWGSYIYGSRYRGTINSPLAVKPDDWLMEFGSTAFDGHGNNNGGGEMAFRVDGAVTASANPSRWELYVTPSGTNSQTLGLKVDSNLAVTAYGNITTSGNLKAPNYLFANGVNILSTVTGNYGNANVASYLVANPQPGTYSNTDVAAYISVNSNPGVYGNTQVGPFMYRFLPNYGLGGINANTISANNVSTINLTLSSVLQFANLTTAQINLISPTSPGMTVYNYTTGNIQVYNGTKWANITLS